ncbi:MAG: guanylate kinase [Clostridiales bacterium]|nr:guanylate kinase [Clostridiales bacterium]
MRSTGMLIIISGPSGSGKGTVVNNLKDADIEYALSISLTTRKKRPGEVNGVDYFFCTESEFKSKRDQNELLEHAVFCNNLYGTPRAYVEEQIELGKAVILEIEVNGALQVKEKFSEAVLVFLIPPTFEELANRLTTRNTESRETIKDRLRRARDEIRLIDKYDYLVLNDEVGLAVDRINCIVKSEFLKPCRNKVLIDNLSEHV